MRNVIVLFLFALLAAAAWGQAPTYVAVPVCGQFSDPALPGRCLSYAGTVRLAWTPGPGGRGWFVTGTLAGNARCMSDAAAYILVSSGALFTASSADGLVLEAPFLAWGQFPLAGRIAVRLRSPGGEEPPTVERIVLSL